MTITIDLNKIIEKFPQDLKENIKQDNFEGLSYLLLDILEEEYQLETELVKNIKENK